MWICSEFSKIILNGIDHAYDDSKEYRMDAAVNWSKVKAGLSSAIESGMLSLILFAVTGTPCFHQSSMSRMWFRPYPMCSLHQGGVREPQVLGFSHEYHLSSGAGLYYTLKTACKLIQSSLYENTEHRLYPLRCHISNPKTSSTIISSLGIY